MAFDTTNLIPRLIDLDFKQVKFCSVSVEQYDKDSIYLETTLYNDSSPYIIPTGTTVSFGGTKPSSHIVLETATIENNKIYYKISEQCTVKEGDYPVKFTLYLPNGAVKYTQEFKIQVRKAVISSDAIADVDEVNVLNELIVDASGAITNANTATTNANNATTSATNAANLANEKAGLADTATTNANTATTNANTATGLANTATDRANVAATNAEAVVVGKTGINDAISNSTTEGWSSSKISGQIGDLTQLQTTSNTDLVGAVNEVRKQTILKPTIFTDIIKSFPNVSTYDAWAKSGVFYDEETDEFVLIFNARSAHTGVTDGDIYMTKKKGYGAFSTPTLVAQHDAVYGRRTHAAGILPNGNYCVIAMLDTADSTGQLIIYISADKGATWTNSTLLIGGSPIDCYEASSVFTTKTGRVLTWVRETTTQQNKVLYSDDNGVTWNAININNGTAPNPLEAEFFQHSDDTIVAICRDRLSTDFSAPCYAAMTRSYDNGVTWETMWTSTLEMTINNCGIYYNPETKTVEMVVGSRFPVDGRGGSLNYYIISEDDAKLGIFGTGKRIALANSTSYDFGYPALAKNKNGVMLACYYDQYNSGAAIYHLMGNSCDIGLSEGDNKIESVSVTSDPDLFEQGAGSDSGSTWDAGKMSTDLRIRTIDAFTFLSNSTIVINCNSSYKFALAIFYDNGTKENVGWANSLTKYMITSGKIGITFSGVDDGNIIPSDVINGQITAKMYYEGNQMHYVPFNKMAYTRQSYDAFLSTVDIIEPYILLDIGSTVNNPFYTDKSVGVRLEVVLVNGVGLTNPQTLTFDANTLSSSFNRGSRIVSQLKETEMNYYVDVALHADKTVKLAVSDYANITKLLIRVVGFIF